VKYILWLNNCSQDGVIKHTKTTIMKHYKENETVIYTDAEGNRFDTFVIFETDRITGLTHINHLNLKVSDAALELHPRSLTSEIPMNDVYSFQLFKQLKEKYADIDSAKNNKGLILHRQIPTLALAKAS
jgi:hypothetical protein